MQAIKNSIRIIEKELECRKASADECILKMTCEDCPLYVSEKDLEMALMASISALKAMDYSFIKEEAETKGE